MKYIYHSGLFEKFYEVNNIKKEDLDTSFFVVDKKEESLINFKEKLFCLKDKRFLIIGDYDCDGICSTAIIKRLLEHLNIKHNYYIPSRDKDGYGLNEDIVKMANENGFDVLLAVDNGISAIEAMKLANSLGIKILIIDHHEYNQEPECEAYIHPRLLKKDYNKLSAGGLSYLFSSLIYDDELSLVYGGLATLADMVGVLGYNRYLIKEMLKVLNKGQIYQINLLNGSCTYDYEDLSFNVIPKINSISRMNYNPNVFLKYLLADKKTCLSTLNSINECNEQRKNVTSKLSKNINKYVVENTNVAVLLSKEIPEGICGLLANKLIHHFNKPVIVLSLKEGLLKGSCRGYDGFNIYEYLKGIKDLFDAFGGHEQACGITLKYEDVEEFLSYIRNTSIEQKETIVDVYEVDVQDLNYSFLNKINDLKPFGIDLKEPLLLLKEANNKYKTKVIVANKYPKYCFGNIDAISFNPKFIDYSFTDIVGKLKKDNYYRNKACFIIEDLL